MCGICGVMNFDGRPVEQAAIGAMCRTIEHRGPDDEGIWTGGGVGLGMRRLSIIDLASGHQPIWNEDNTVCVVFNGEIYNYQELRERLVRAGHRFRTNADTEVIVHLYEDHGVDCVAHLEGMFAFAIWDTREQRLLLARDRLGEKPLAYFADGRRLVFGSEIKALTAFGVSSELDVEAIYHYFTLLSVPAPLTVFRHVRKLMPGHYLTCDRRGQIEIRQYWDVNCWDASAPVREADRLAELDALLQRSVRQRLIADVPVGALLSGGIDSSLIVALMSKISNAPLRTFSVGFEDSAESNELPFARQVAERFGTVHEEMHVRPDIQSLLPRLVWQWDEPFAVSSAVPTYLLAKVVRQHVKVVLTGDGGDELFAGYPRYQWDHWADRLGWPGAIAGRGFAALLGQMVTPTPQLRRPLRFARSLSMPPDARYTFYLSKVDAAAKRDLFTPEWLEQFKRLGLVDTAVLDRAYKDFAGHDPLNRRLYGDIKSSLPDEMLTKVDRMSMAASLEARPPLLDHHLVEFAATLPTSDKLQGRTSKRLLKMLAAQCLPPAILNRPKHGFDVPVGSWLRGPLKEFAEDVILSPTAEQRGVWKPAVVRALWQRHQRGEAGHADSLWVLLNWELWCQVVFDRLPPPEHPTS
jgi:asparagine synthase (glutamine-hydrolysing)